jgi:hypothetical protein
MSVPPAAGRSVYRLNDDVLRDAASERNLHPVDPHEERAAKRATAGDADRVARMDAEMIQSPTRVLSASNVDDARFVPGSELGKCHDS